MVMYCDGDSQGETQFPLPFPLPHATPSHYHTHTHLQPLTKLEVILILGSDQFVDVDMTLHMILGEGRLQQLVVVDEFIVRSAITEVDRCCQGKVEKILCERVLKSRWRQFSTTKIFSHPEAVIITHKSERICSLESSINNLSTLHSVIG